MKKETMLREVLSDYRDDFTLCGKCKLCHACDVTEVDEGRFWRNCPAGTRFRYEGYYASGRLEMARALEQFEIEPTPALIHSLYSCMLCGACQERCYYVKEMLPMRVFELIREKAVREGWGPLPAHRGVIENMEASDNFFGQPQVERAGWLEGLNLKDASEEKCEFLLFAGCRYSFDPDRRQAARSAAGLLVKAGFAVGALGSEELCCGAPLLELGDRDFFEAFAEENLRRMEAAGVKVVVSLCPHCSRVLAEEYAPGSGIEFRHAVEVMAEALEEGRLKPAAAIASRAAWHDPCNLGRRLGVYEAPRKTLESVPGLELRELPRNRSNALCCGGGGMAAHADPEYGDWVAGERLYEAAFSEADTLITACPHCEETLLRGAVSGGHPVEVRNIFSVIEESAGGGDR